MFQSRDNSWIRILLLPVFIFIYIIPLAFSEEDKQQPINCASMFIENNFPDTITFQTRFTENSVYKDSEEYKKIESIISKMVSFEDNPQNIDSMKYFKTTPILRFHLYTLVTDILKHEKFAYIRWNHNRKYQSFDEFMFEVTQREWFSQRVDKVIADINVRVLNHIRGYYEDEEKGIVDTYGKTLFNMMMLFGKALTLRSDIDKIKVASIQNMLRYEVKKEKLQYTPIDIVVGLYYWFDYNSDKLSTFSKSLLSEDPEVKDKSIETIYNSYSNYNQLQKIALISYLVKDNQLVGAKMQGIAYLLGQYILSHSEDKFDKILVEELIMNNRQLMNRVYIFGVYLSTVESNGDGE